MKKQKKLVGRRLMALILTVTMLLGMVPVTAFGTETELTWSGGKINLLQGTTVGTYALNTLEIYKQNAYPTVPEITGVTQDGTTINITLAEDTDPSYPLQMGFGPSTGQLTQTGTKCTLDNGQGTASVYVTYKRAANAAPMEETFTVNFSIPMGEPCEIETPDIEGVEFTGKITAYKEKPYSFNVVVEEGYNGTDMAVSYCHGEETVALEPVDDKGNYQIESVPGDIKIIVTGVVKKEIHTVTLTEGNGYTIFGQETSYAGEDYTFTVTVDDAIYKASEIVVRVNGEKVDLTDGKYTFEALDGDKTVTVENVVERQIFNIEKPEVPGVTVSGGDTVREGKPYTFSVSVDEAYDASEMTVLINGEPVELISGSYTIDAVNENIAINVTGVDQKTVYTVTLTEGNGYMISGQNTSYGGEDYTFTVTVDDEIYKAGEIVVKVNDIIVEGINGKYTIGALDGDKVVTVENVVEREVFTITKPVMEGVTVSGEETVREGKSYTFTVDVNEIYDASEMDVAVNGEIVTLANNSYTIPEVRTDVVITVSGVVKKDVCEITTPVGVGFTFNAEKEYVYKGNDYSFTVIPNLGYVAEVKVNGEVIVGSNTQYTIQNVTSDLVITVATEKVPLLEEQELEISVENEAYKIDVTNKELKPFNRYHATVTDIKVSGAKVASAYEDGTTVYFVLNSDTPDSGEIDVEFLYTSNECTLKDNTLKLVLKDGETGKKHTVTADYIGWKKSSVEYTLIFFRELPAEEPPRVIKSTDSAILWENREIEIDLEMYFLAADKYYLVGEAGNTIIDGKIYTFTPSSPGEYILTFVAENEAGSSETVTFTVKAELPVRLQEQNNEVLYLGGKIVFDLTTYFSKATTYFVKNGDVNVPIEGTEYIFTPDKVGKYTLVFGAKNSVGMCEDWMTVDVTVDRIVGGYWIGHSTSSGSWNYVKFYDENGDLIENVNVVREGNSIQVELPKKYNPAGKVKALYNLTQNNEGFPYLTTSKETAGTTSSQAPGQKFVEKSTTLTGGEGKYTFYYYNESHKNKKYDTFTLSYKINNDIPVLAEGVKESTKAAITAGENYTLDLKPLFTDVDEDPLTYLVSVNEADAVAADVNYTFTTTVANTYKLVFAANDGKGISTDTYTVVLTVENAKDTYRMSVGIPEDLEPKFYVSTGFENGVDQLGDEVVAVKEDTSGGVTSYILVYPMNASVLSVRTDDWGGMSFDAVKDSTISLRKAQFAVVDYDNKPASSTNTVTYSGNTAVSGTNGWLLVTGEEYVFTAIPTDATTLATASKTETLASGVGTYTAQMMLNIKNPLTITAPTGASVKLYKYDVNKYYFSTEVDAKIVTNNGDGTITYNYVADTTAGNGPAADVYIYHVSVDGKLSKAGWIKWGQQNLTVTYTDQDKSSSYRLDDYTTTGAANSDITEDSVLLNINSRNHLNMSVGQEKVLKAYRAWEIIKISYQNYILTPDFTYTILSGDDVVSLTEKDSSSTAEGDWMTLTALKNGVAVIEVAYDAMEVQGGSYDGIYGASDPARTGLVVVQVGEKDDTSVDFGIDSFSSIGKNNAQNISYNPNNKKAWDAEFDTLYFIGNSGELKLTPSASSTIAEVAVSHDKGVSWTVLNDDDADGTFTAEIVSGNNIIRVKTAEGTAYQVVRGDKLTVKLREIEGKSDGDGIAEAGETIRISLIGLHSPIPKMAGNYNPGFGGNNDGYSSQHLNYTYNGKAIYGPGSQYNFITSSNYVDIIMPEDGSEAILEDGYIGVGVLGLSNFVNGDDSHRNIPDAGCGTRDSKTTFHTRSILPKITITAGSEVAPNTAPIVRGDAPVEKSIYSDQKYAVNPDTLFQDADGNSLTFTVAVNGGEAVQIGADYKFTPTGTGTYTLTFTASDGKETAEHTITLTVTERPQEEEKPNEFDLMASEIAGYVTISFEDKGIRVEGESGLDYPVPLGMIVPKTKVPFKKGETIAQVTKRVLDYYEIGMEYSGTLTSGFYLGAITDFEVDGVPYDSMGEFDAGEGSGWMITWKGEFINEGASEFVVKNGDYIRWQYTCQLGADIGDPFWADKEYTPSLKEEEQKPSASLTPEASTNSKGEASVEIKKDELTSAVEEATKDNTAGTVVIAPEIKGDASKVTVELPKEAVDSMATSGKTDLTVKTDIATVTLPADTLKELPTDGKTVSVAVETVKGDATAAAGSTAAADKIVVEVAVDNKAVDKIGSGVVASIPAKDVSATSVLVIVDAEGNETIVKKSAVADGEITALLEGSCTVVVKDNKKEFTDTEGHWGKGAAEFASSRELFNGVGNGQFGMNTTMNRAMMATVFYNLENGPEHDGEHDFHDVDENRYYAKPVAWAAESGVLSGYNDGSFRADAPVTREQLAVMLWNYSGKPSGIKALEHSDAGNISNYAKEAMQWAVENGVMSGRANGQLDPKGAATRAEVAQMFKNYIEKVVL